MEYKRKMLTERIICVKIIDLYRKRIESDIWNIWREHILCLNSLMYVMPQWMRR